MGARTITLRAFCSAKGGVGKSTLAIACAKLIAREGAMCVLIDADLTGTSLADGLRLRAPAVPVRRDGTLDLEAAPVDDLFTAVETRRLRNARHAASSDQGPRPPVYFNDALLYRSEDESRECRVDAFLWKHERDDRVLYLPSSPLQADIERALGWLFGEREEADWQRRVLWLLDEMALRMPHLTDVVVDLPPGLFGFAHAVLELMSLLSQDEPLPEGAPDWAAKDLRWEVRPFLVTSQDENDLQVAMEYFAESYPELPELVPLVNRAWKPPQSIRADVRAMFEERVGVLDVEQHLGFVSELRATLGRLFLPGVNDLILEDVDPAELERLQKALGVGGRS